MKKASSGKKLNANLELTPIWKFNCCPLLIRSRSTKYNMPRSKNSSDVYRPKYKKKAHSSLVLLSVYPRSRRGAERIRQGEERWSRPLKTALERSYLTENSSSESRILRPRRKKLLTESPPKRISYISLYFYMITTRKWYIRADCRS